MPAETAAQTVPPAMVLWLITAGAVAVTAWAGIGAPQPVRFNLPLLAHTSGLLAGYGVTVMVALMSRAPALERGVGADRLARWHGKGGRAIFCLILIHGIAATAAWATVQGTSVWAATIDVLRMPGLIAATAGTIIFLTVGAISAQSMRRKLRYETWHFLHLLTYLAIALSFSHELAGPDLAGLPLVQVAWSLLYTFSFGLILRYRVLAPLTQAWRHRLRVDHVVDEGAGVVSIILRGRHLHELNAESGQFFRWRFLTRTLWRSSHPFSLSAPPHHQFLRITVKAVGDGTRSIHAVRPGARVLAAGPYGAMTNGRRQGRGVLLIGGGVGITPMRALFETLPVPGRDLTLLYRASSTEEILFRDELEHIARHRGAQLIFLTGPASDPRNAITAQTLKAIVPDLAARDVYICASPRLSSAATTALTQAGLPRRQLHHEDFNF
ncbi:ferric reductase-like transmembrane domain-containing protein [Arthrobacter sp. ov118]|uniref:ferredoxin reductase family protein n=1 Tax=Arthrobacter sp. ov118 TaxID=1761747 RepID=UPI0008E736AD|nr:ferredoxin reductase family protein [Arthrobacter sp. ov118]SFU03047.1 Predicted ferric reductase [Arthrobacter sp. ov118]